MVLLIPGSSGEASQKRCPWCWQPCSRQQHLSSHRGDDVVEALNALAPHTCPQLLEICEKAGWTEKKNKKKKHSNNWNKNQNFMKHPTDQPHVPPQPFGQLRYTCPATSILAGQKGWKQEFSRTMSRGVVLESLRDSLYFPVKDALKHITFQFRTGIAHRNRRPMLVGKWHEAAHRPASYPTHPFWIITKHIFSSFNPVRSKGEKTRFSQEPWGVVLESCLGWLVSSKAYSETHYASIQNRNWT